ncbi:hypothetical protein [Streptomyces durocortorensis]|uniref:hypothetical protein n=1 Tax=Streptomyces durocortorensis TaxID=2811104 RepID=UPI0027DBDD39|nr:hypothetical protein [Streptomyces durocortorensis]
MNHLLCGLAANVNLPSPLVDRLIAVADAEVAHHLADRAVLSHAQAVALAARVEESAVQLAYGGLLTAADVDPLARPDVALALLDTGAGPAAWARLLAADPVVGHREKLAACPDLPPDVVEALTKDTDIRVVAEIAQWAPAHVAARLAAHPYAEVRRAAAANEATPPSALGALVSGDGLPAALHCLVCDRETPPFAHDPHCPRLDCDLRPGASCDGTHTSTTHDLLQAALLNPATPAEAVVGFVDHPSLLLRWALAARRDLPSEVYEALAADPNPGVRADLAENPAIGDTLIRALADDDCHEVRRGLAHHPDVPLDVLVRLAAGTRIGATLPPRTASASPVEVEALAGSPNAAARTLVAQRRDLPAGIRDALAADPDAKVVKSIAPHPGFTEPQLRTMAARHGVQVIASIAANPDATPALLAELARHRPPARKALRAIARHPNATAPALLACLEDDEARVEAAGHPALPPEAITALVRGSDERSAEAAAANPSLPHTVMTDLLPPAPVRAAGSGGFVRPTGPRPPRGRDGRTR